MEEKQLRVDCVKSVLDNLGNDLLGELLTITEAIVPEKQRVPSAKSLVKQALWRRIHDYKDRLDGLVDLQKTEVK